MMSITAGTQIGTPSYVIKVNLQRLLGTDDLCRHGDALQSRRRGPSVKSHRLSGVVAGGTAVSNGVLRAQKRAVVGGALRMKSWSWQNDFLDGAAPVAPMCRCGDG